MKKITIQDVAKNAGVGIGTVSRALNDSKEISSVMKKRVFDSIKELGYIPDQLAQSMRSKRYKTVALFMDLSNPAFAKITQGVHDELKKLGYILSLCDLRSTDEVDVVVSFLEGRGFDGIILSSPSEDDQELHELFKEVKIPIVTLDRDIPELPAGIITDYYSSVKKATEYLIRLGHFHIALVGGTPGIRPTRGGVKGYKDAFASMNIELNNSLIFTDKFTSNFGQEVVSEVQPLIYKGELTAMISLNSQIFRGLLQGFKKSGLQYPKDISLITFEDDELTQLIKPEVTVIRRQLVEMGENVAKVLVKYIEKPNVYGSLFPITMSTEFIIRDSCRAIN